VLNSPGFRALVRSKWTVSIVLTLLLFVVYYGYILLIAYDKELLARKVGASTTLGIPLGMFVIVLAWVLTAVYVAWANRSHDDAVRKLRDQIRS
jgi:uncharacterized membrane protein (DUF485 family)